MKNPYFSIAKRLLKLRKKPVIARRMGAMWLLYPRDWIDNRLLIGRPFEREQLKFTENYMRDHEVSVFYDCGANIGLYSVLMGMLVPQLKKIHAFEPVKKTYGRLSANIMLNDLHDQVIPHNIGLGNQDQELEISIDLTSTGVSTLNTDQLSLKKAANRVKEKILVRKFDSIFDNKDERAFFKIDVEGYEKTTIEGMKNYFQRNECVLQIELWDKNQQKMKQEIQALGFKNFHQINHDFYFRNF